MTEHTIKFFQADWCGPCKEQKPIVEEVTNNVDGVTIEEFDIEDDQEAVNRYNIRSVPTLIIERGDEVIEQLSGLTQQSELKTVLNG
jgi:thioredoxin 1